MKEEMSVKFSKIGNSPLFLGDHTSMLEEFIFLQYWSNQGEDPDNIHNSRRHFFDVETHAVKICIIQG